MNISAGSTELVYRDTETWQHLKQVIASSSGFEKWQRSRDKDGNKLELPNDYNLDQLVTSYLRETLETLAY